MEIPPAEYVEESLLTAVAPSLATAFLMVAPFLLLLRGRLAPLGSALALAAGLAVGNYFCKTRLDWQPWVEEQAGVRRILAAAGVALAIGMLARLLEAPALARRFGSRQWIPIVVGWLLRAGAAGFTAWITVPDHVRAEARWADYAVGLAILAEWAILERLAIREPGGALPLATSAALFTAALVIIHAGSKLPMDMATFASTTLFGLAVAACLRPADVSGAMPGVAVMLTTLLLNGWSETESKVPFQSFLIVGLAPLALAPLLIPRVGRLNPVWRVLIGSVLLLTPLVIAARMAMLAEDLYFP